MAVWRARSPSGAAGRIVARIIGCWPPVGGRTCVDRWYGSGRRPVMMFVTASVCEWPPVGL